MITKNTLIEQAKKVRHYTLERRGATDLIDGLLNMINLIGIEEQPKKQIIKKNIFEAILEAIENEDIQVAKNLVINLKKYIEDHLCQCNNNQFSFKNKALHDNYVGGSIMLQMILNFMVDDKK